MTFTVNDFSDLLKLLETHPEWRQELRQVLFPEIDIPKALQELAEAQHRTEVTLKRLEATVERYIGRMEAGFAEARAEREAGFAEARAERERLSERMEAGFAEARAEREAGFAEARAGRERLSERMEAGFAEARVERKAMRHDIGELKGRTHEIFYHIRADAIFGYYLKRGRNVTEWVADQLQAAQEAGQVSAAEYINVMAADYLWEGQLRWGTTKQEVILVIEASWLAEAHDVERAVARAAILRRLGLKAIPVVAGREWAEGIVEVAQERGVVLTKNGRVDDPSWQAALSN